MKAEANKERDILACGLHNLKDTLRMINYWKKLDEMVKSAQKKKENFEGQFKPPHHKNIELVPAIRAYLSSSSTKKLFSDLKELALDKDKVPTKAEMKQVFHGLLKRLMVQSGHRPQVY